MFACKYCGKEFEKSYQIAAHSSMCKANPNSRVNKYQKKYVDITQNCPKCGNEFTLHIPENTYLHGDFRKYCSKFCANSHKHSLETREKISEGVRNYLKSIDHNYSFIEKNTIHKLTTKLKPLKKQFTNICKCCGNIFISYGQKLNFCSKECKARGFALICQQCNKTFYHDKIVKYCSKECKDKAIHNVLSEAGKTSARRQSEIRRSKSEIEFCQLCEKYFNKVTHNDSIFNGWDADILIWDHKIAVLWNGKWHYEKITKSHSVLQVQNRDKIKCQEIENAGWKYYIIKDIKKYNKNFVKEQFDIFVNYINTCGMM